VAASPRTLFLYFADECHVAPAKDMVPHKFLMELDKYRNVIQLLISATPWNMMTRDSSVPKRHVVVHPHAGSNVEHSLSKDEFVLVSSCSADDVDQGFVSGYVEGRLPEGEKRIPLSCLDPEELHIISWHHRARCKLHPSVREGEVVVVEDRLDESIVKVRGPDGKVSQIPIAALESECAKHMPISRTIRAEALVLVSSVLIHLHFR
jgi:hypothetical protein